MAFIGNGSYKANNFRKAIFFLIYIIADRKRTEIHQKFFINALFPLPIV